jgi:hypothetical protein
MSDDDRPRSVALRAQLEPPPLVEPAPPPNHAAGFARGFVVGVGACLLPGAFLTIATLALGVSVPVAGSALVLCWGAGVYAMFKRGHAEGVGALLGGPALVAAAVAYFITHLFR